MVEKNGLFSSGHTCLKLDMTDMRESKLPTSTTYSQSRIVRPDCLTAQAKSSNFESFGHDFILNAGAVKQARPWPPCRDSTEMMDFMP